MLKVELTGSSESATRAWPMALLMAVMNSHRDVTRDLMLADTKVVSARLPVNRSQKTYLAPW